MRPEIAAEIAAAKVNYNLVMACKIPLSMSFVAYWGKAAIWNSGCGEFVDRRRTAGLEGLRNKQISDRDEKIPMLEEEVKSVQKLLEEEKRKLQKREIGNHNCGLVSPHPDCQALHIQVKTQSHGAMQVT